METHHNSKSRLCQTAFHCRNPTYQNREFSVCKKTFLNNNFQNLWEKSHKHEGKGKQCKGRHLNFCLGVGDLTVLGVSCLCGRCLSISVIALPSSTLRWVRYPYPTAGSTGGNTLRHPGTDASRVWTSAALWTLGLQVHLSEQSTQNGWWLVSVVSCWSVTNGHKSSFEWASRFPFVFRQQQDWVVC